MITDHIYARLTLDLQDAPIGVSSEGDRARRIPMTSFSRARHLAFKHAATLVGATLLLSAGHTAAHAYLDPGTGSIILQGLIAGIIGTAALARMYWTRLKLIFRRTFGHDQDQGGDQPQ
jgi:hypothetical protein